MRKGSVTFLCDGYDGVYVPITVKDWSFGQEEPRGRLTILDRDTGKKQFSCIVPQDKDVAGKIFEE